MRKKALIIEENDSLRNLLNSFLSKKFEAVAVHNGFEAMICLHNGFIPDIIVNADLTASGASTRHVGERPVPFLL